MKDEDGSWKGWARKPETSVKTATSRRLRDDMTPQEVKVWNWLREELHPAGWKFRRQQRIGPYVVDFASLRPKIVIELDGDTHGSEAGKQADARRDEFLKSEGFLVLRFWNSEIGTNASGFIDALLGEIQKAGLSPAMVSPE